MHFCKTCSNMYYVKLSEGDENKLSYYCRNCGSTDDTMLSENICVSKINLNNNSQKIDLFINEYTKLDPTLPRTKSIKCPNEKCTSNIDNNSNDTNNDGNTKKQEREVLYIRYDDRDMKYIYMCCNCDFTWKTNLN